MVAAWGAHARLDRVATVRGLLADGAVLALGLTRLGHPRHPLYVRADQPLLAWPG